MNKNPVNTGRPKPFPERNERLPQINLCPFAFNFHPSAHTVFSGPIQANQPGQFGHCPRVETPFRTLHSLKNATCHCLTVKPSNCAAQYARAVSLSGE